MQAAIKAAPTANQIVRRLGTSDDPAREDPVDLAQHPVLRVLLCCFHGQRDSLQGQADVGEHGGQDLLGIVGQIVVDNGPGKDLPLGEGGKGSNVGGKVDGEELEVGDVFLPTCRK